MFVDMDQTNTAQDGLTVQAAAARVGVPANDIRAAISRGEIPASERFSLIVQPAAVDAWAARTTGAGQ